MMGRPDDKSLLVAGGIEFVFIATLNLTLGII